MELKETLFIIAAVLFAGIFLWAFREKKEVAVFNKLILFPRWFKYIGLVIFVLSAILPFSMDLLIDGKNYIGLNFANLGLFIICFSRDKIEDEMTNLVRLKSFYRSVVLGFVYVSVMSAIYILGERSIENTLAVQLVFVILFSYLNSYYITKWKIRRAK
jgi:hypothetical protein